MSHTFYYDQTNEELFSFLDKSPNAYYAASNMKDILLDHGYTQLLESQTWHLEEGGKYVVTRNGSALIAFQIPKDPDGFRILASHLDSPAFKIKPNAEIAVEQKYIKLNIEKYGGMIQSTWMDRPLSVAGRVIVRTDAGIESRLVNLDEDLVMIPSLAIHMNRDANDGYKFNPQQNLPLYGQIDAQETFMTNIAESAGVNEEDILDTDLYLYNRMKATRLGAQKEFIASGRLDDQQCAFASLKGFLAAEPKQIAVHAALDNEEVGSTTRQGAAGTFLSDVLHRIAMQFGDEDTYLRMLANSFMVSADNAHALHPNHADKTDPTNRPCLNEGIVIKYSANQKYTSDALSAGMFKLICEKAGVPYQTFVNRSDMLGGSTLGNISQSQVSVPSVDVGLPQLSMHSSYEMAGAKDTAYLAEAAKELFSSSNEEIAEGVYRIE